MKKRIYYVFAIIVSSVIQLKVRPKDKLVPKNFKVPHKFENKYFRIRKLKVKDAKKDFEAITSSHDHLQNLFSEAQNWPEKPITFEEDIIDLVKEEKRFKERSSFAYTVVSLDETQVLGCVYIYPCHKCDYDAEITMWMRKSAFDEGLVPILYNSVREWIKKDWPFKNPGYPGRELSWKVWNSLK